MIMNAWKLSCKRSSSKLLEWPQVVSPRDELYLGWLLIMPLSSENVPNILAPFWREFYSKPYISASEFFGLGLRLDMSCAFNLKFPQCHFPDERKSNKQSQEVSSSGFQEIEYLVAWADLCLPRIAHFLRAPSQRGNTSSGMSQS